MDFKQLTTLREIFRTGSVSEAARSLGRTQPAVSHTLSKLEDELGMKLFKRQAGRLFALPETEYMVEQSSRLLEELDTLQSTMARMKAAQKGKLRVVSMPGPAIEFLPAIFADYCTSAPDVNVTLLSRSSEAVVRLVEARQFDIGIADHLPDTVNRTLGSRHTFSFQRICAVPQSHHLAQKKWIDLEDLSGVPLAVLFSEHATTRDLRVAFESQGLAFCPRFEGQFFLHLMPYVAAAQACALVDPIAQMSWTKSHSDAHKVCFVPLRTDLAFAVDLITPSTPVQSQLSQVMELRIAESLRALQNKAPQFTS